MTGGEAVSRVDPVPVQVGRIEVKIDYLVKAVDGVVARVDKHEERLNDIDVQLASIHGASASWKSWVPVLLTVIGLGVAIWLGVK